MPETQASFTFGELVEQGVLEIGDGYRAKLEELGGTGPIFLRAGLLTEGGINWSGAERFHARLTPKVRPKFGYPDDTVVTTKGNSVGRIAYIPSDAPPFVYSPHLSYWRSNDSSRLLPGFLRYWSQSAEFTKQLNAMANSTDMAPYLSLIDQRRLRISLPEISAQSVAVSILGALDNKISVNDRIAVVADELIRSSYRKQCQESHEKIRIDKLGTVVRDTVPADALTGSENYIGLEHAPKRKMWMSVWRPSEGIASAKTRFNRGDVLFGKLRPYFHKVGIAFVDGVSSTDILVIRPTQGIFRGWLLAALASDDVVAHASAVGDGTRMPRAKWSDLAGFEVPWIGHEDAARFNELVSSISDRVASASAESRTLTELRGALLPKLMTGELRINDADRTVEEAT